MPERPKLPGVRWTACMRELSCSLCSCGTLDFAECRSGLESASQKTKYYCTSETKDYMSEASDDEKTSRLDRCPHQVDGQDHISAGSMLHVDAMQQQTQLTCYLFKQAPTVLHERDEGLHERGIGRREDKPLGQVSPPGRRSAHSALSCAVS